MFLKLDNVRYEELMAMSIVGCGALCSIADGYSVVLPQRWDGRFV
jgi:hypothetical protein